MSDNHEELPPLPTYSQEPGIKITDDHKQLLLEACIGYGHVHNVTQFGSGKSGAVSYLFIGNGKPYEVAKFDHPKRLAPEFDAYQDFVYGAGVPKQYRVELRGGLQTNDAGTSGLIIYNYLGDDRNLAGNPSQKMAKDADFQQFFDIHKGTVAAETLERLIQHHERWRDHPYFKRESFAYDEEYDRFLPVSLSLMRIFQPDTTSTAILKSGAIQWEIVNKLQVGQIVTLEQFEVTDTRGEILRLRGLSPEEERSTYVRIKLDRMELDRYQPGDIIPPVTAQIVATRQELLEELVSETNAIFREDQADIDISGKRHENPLKSVNEILGTRLVRAQFSIIHGDLNLRNIMVDPQTRAAWLIDFADTRIGPTLLDFQRLEEHVISLLLVPRMEKAKINPNFIVDILNALHTDDFGLINKLRFYRLREPIILLRKIRQLAKNYLVPTEDWTEYYRGLFLVFIGALKYDRTPYQREVLLIGAATAKYYISPPELPKTVYEPKDVTIMKNVLLGILIGALVIIFLNWLNPRQRPEPPVEVDNPEQIVANMLTEAAETQQVNATETAVAKSTQTANSEATATAIEADTLTRVATRSLIIPTTTPVMPTINSTPTPSDTSEPAAASTPSAILTGEPLIIGVAIDLSGENSLLGRDQKIGAELVEMFINKRTGINGRPIDIRILDNTTDPTDDKSKIVQNFKNLIEMNAVAIIGPSLSDQALVVDRVIAERYSENGQCYIPIVGPSNTHPDIPEIGYCVLRISAPVSRYAPLAVNVAFERTGFERVAVAYAEDDAFSSAETLAFQHAITTTYSSTELVAVETFQTTDNQFTEQTQKIIKSQPDLVIVSGLQDDGGKFITQLREAGYQGSIIGGNGLNTPRILTRCKCEGVIIAQAYSGDYSFDTNDEFIKTYHEFFEANTIYPDDHFTFPPQFTAQMFSAVQVIVQALNNIDRQASLTQMDIDEQRRALLIELLSGVTFDTPLGNISFANNGEVQQERFFVSEIRDGQFRTIDMK